MAQTPTNGALTGEDSSTISRTEDTELTRARKMSTEESTRVAEIPNEGIMGENTTKGVLRGDGSSTTPIMDERELAIFRMVIAEGDKDRSEWSAEIVEIQCLLARLRYEIHELNEAIKELSVAETEALSNKDEEKLSVARERRASAENQAEMALEEANRRQVSAERDFETAERHLVKAVTRGKDYSDSIEKLEAKARENSRTRDIQSPTFKQLEFGNWKAPYARPPCFEENLRNLQQLIQLCPISENQNQKYDILTISGLMGVGKTRYADELMTEACKMIPPEGRKVIRLHVPLCMITVDYEQDVMNVLAKTLLWAFRKYESRSSWNGVTWKDVVKQAIRDLGQRPLVLMNIDAGQHYMENTCKILKDAIVEACIHTMQDASNGDDHLVVIPLLSGIVDNGTDPEVRSNFVMRNVHLRAHTGDLLSELRKGFCQCLGLTLADFEGESLSNLRHLFNLCDGVPRLVAMLRVELFQPEIKSALCEKELSQETAEAIFERMLYRLKKVYDINCCCRFLSMHFNIRNSGMRPGFLGKLALSVIHQVLLDIITETVVNPEDQIVIPIDKSGLQQESPDTWEKYCQLSPVRYRDLHRTGIVELVQAPDSNGMIVTAPSLVILAMNSIVKLFPKEVGILNPFSNHWETHERIASFSFRMHLKMALFKPPFEYTLMSTFRPGAQWLGNDDVRVYGICQLLLSDSFKLDDVFEFVFWVYFVRLSSKELIVVRSDIFGETSYDPMIVEMAANRSSVNGFVHIPKVTPKQDQVLLLFECLVPSPSKIKKEMGPFVDTKSYNGTVLDRINRLREKKNKLISAHPHLVDSTFVYEVFTNGLEPQDVNNLIHELDSNERAVLIPYDNFIKANGDPFSKMLRKIQKVSE